MKVNCVLVYPKLDNVEAPAAWRSHRQIPLELNIGCSTWKTNTAMRHGFCELIFAGAGNHPGLWDDVEGHPFESGDNGIDNVHRQWEAARTRSVSVGDLINIDPRGLNEWWVCDNCGWTLLTPDQVVSWLQFPRQYGCCFIELNKWMDTLTTHPGDAMTI